MFGFHCKAGRWRFLVIESGFEEEDKRPGIQEEPGPIELQDPVAFARRGFHQCPAGQAGAASALHRQSHPARLGGNAVAAQSGVQFSQGSRRDLNGRTTEHHEQVQLVSKNGSSEGHGFSRAAQVF